MEKSIWQLCTVSVLIFFVAVCRIKTKSCSKKRSPSVKKKKFTSENIIFRQKWGGIIAKPKLNMNYRSSTELSKLLSTCLSPISPLLKPASLHSLCLRTAAIYATTALYEFHDKKSSPGSTIGKYTAGQKVKKKSPGKKLMKSSKSNIFFREITFLAVLNFFPVQIFFGHF